MSPRPNAKYQKQIHLERAIKFAQKLEDGWEYHEELRLSGKFPLVKGRRFQLEEESGWFIFHSVYLDPRHGENGIRIINCYGPLTKAGDPKAGCHNHDFPIDEGLEWNNKKLVYTVKRVEAQKEKVTRKVVK
tara:strand:- start:5 stop:400 length:396 start_codon:yes stop_codon:yes gene_type:complete